MDAVTRRTQFANMLLAIAIALGLSSASFGQNPRDVGSQTPKRPVDDRFRQLDEILPSPNVYRNAAGAPGPQYWQQKVDYVIDVTLDDENQRMTGSEEITYENRSPDTLRYLWVQLDNSNMAKGSDAQLIQEAPDFDEFSYRTLKRLIEQEAFDGVVNITAVTNRDGTPLAHTINKTMMRVDLPTPLAPGSRFRFRIDWNYEINDAKAIRARTGYEYFPDDDNYLYEIAHWFPRLAPYTDVNGWQNKQFLGRGEFALEFGDYEVRITAPADHVVSATGELQNSSQVLTDAQRDRLEQAENSDVPIFVITPEEAKANESSRSTETKTWIFRAQNVRDFAWASSRKFIWDAQLHVVGEQPVWCMSYYPNEGEPLWSRYSTHAIIHTLDVYSKYTFDYPYPVAISVNGPIGGMEYPMICFNGPRPEDDGTYSKRTKYGLISVIIHEVGHNYFPMIVNSDERQWTWMDEGLNTFVQFLAEQEWEKDYPSRRGEPRNIVSFMTSENQVPIMTNSESLLQFGNNAYAKPATALNVLRETILGRDLFDFAFKEYSRRWMFKRPEPADLFRTLEDASAVDLDWFWRGWFYSTDHCDIGIRGVHFITMDTRDPDVDKGYARARKDEAPTTKSETRNADLAVRTQRYPELLDFYNDFDELDVTPQDKRRFERLVEKLEDDEKELLLTERNFFVVDFENIGGLVMPILLDLEFEDGSRESLRIPAEIWRRNPLRVSKLIMIEKMLTRIVLDPQEETADSDRSNNFFPPEPVRSRFQLFKRKKEKNPMQKARDASDPKLDDGGKEEDEGGK